MLRDRYDEVDIFARVPQLSQAMEPVIAQLNVLLDDDTIFQQVKSGLTGFSEQRGKRGIGEQQAAFISDAQERMTLRKTGTSGHRGIHRNEINDG